MMVRDALDQYENRPPSANDVGLVIEVADASLTLDRRLKGRIYARAGSFCIGLLNLVDNQLEVFSNASGPVPMPGFQERQVYRVEDKLSLVVGLGELGTIKVRDLLP